MGNQGVGVGCAKPQDIDGQRYLRTGQIPVYTEIHEAPNFSKITATHKSERHHKSIKEREEHVKQLLRQNSMKHKAKKKQRNSSADAQQQFNPPRAKIRRATTTRASIESKRMDAFVNLIPEDNDVSDADISMTIQQASNPKTYKRANTDPEKSVRFKFKRQQSVRSVNSITTDEEDNTSQNDIKSILSNNKSVRSTNSKNKRVTFALNRTKRKHSVLSVNSFNTDEDLRSQTEDKPQSDQETKATLPQDRDTEGSPGITEEDQDHTYGKISKLQLALDQISPEPEKFSSKYKSPRNEPELVLEVMHDYFEIKSTYEAASISDRAELEGKVDASKLKDFFADMGSAYGTISYLDPSQKADFAQALCEFMDKTVPACDDDDQSY